MNSGSLPFPNGTNLIYNNSIQYDQGFTNGTRKEKPKNTADSSTSSRNADERKRT